MGTLGAAHKLATHGNSWLRPHGTIVQRFYHSLRRLSVSQRPVNEQPMETLHILALPLSCSLTRSLAYPRDLLLARSLTGSLNHSTRCLARSLIHSLALANPLARSPTRSITRLLARSIIVFLNQMIRSPPNLTYRHGR